VSSTAPVYRLGVRDLGITPLVILILLVEFLIPRVLGNEKSFQIVIFVISVCTLHIVEIGVGLGGLWYYTVVLFDYGLGPFWPWTRGVGAGGWGGMLSLWEYSF
jgi:hypothetical protein